MSSLQPSIMQPEVHQLQTQLQQMQVQMSSLQPSHMQPEQFSGVQIPVWPQPPIVPQMHVLTSPQQGCFQAPSVKMAKVRAGRLGKRERAELKASRSSSSRDLRQAEHVSEGSGKEHEDLIADSWVLEGQREGQAQSTKSNVDKPDLQQCTETFCNLMKAELTDCKEVMREEFGQMMSVGMAMMKEVMLSHKAEVDNAISSLKEDLEPTLAKNMATAIEEAATSTELRCKGALGELLAQTKPADDELRLRMESGMHSVVQVVESLKVAVGEIKANHHLKPELTDCKEAMKKELGQMMSAGMATMKEVMVSHKAEMDIAISLLKEDLEPTLAKNMVTAMEKVATSSELRCKEA